MNLHATPPTSLRWHHALTATGIVLAALLIELAMGRTFLSKSGQILLWVNVTNGPETSQQIADWYSISHITHGMIFYGFLWLVLPRKVAQGWRMVLVVALEAVFEIFENSPWIINRFRETTMATGYYGDTVLNSTMDILFNTCGYFIARYLPVWASIGIFVLIEVGLALLVRDNLIINIIMLIHPIEGIRQWQNG